MTKHPQNRAERRRLGARSRFKDHPHENETKKYKDNRRYDKLRFRELEKEYAEQEAKEELQNADTHIGVLDAKGETRRFNRSTFVSNP